MTARPVALAMRSALDTSETRLAVMVDHIRAAGDVPARYVDIAFEVPERKQAAWPDAIRSGFEPARTVKTGALQIAIVDPEDRS